MLPDYLSFFEGLGEKNAARLVSLPSSGSLFAIFKKKNLWLFLETVNASKESSAACDKTLTPEKRMDYDNQAIWLMASCLSGKHVTKIAATYGGFLKWWYPTTIGFPTKNDHFGVFLGYHHLRKHPYYNRSHLSCKCGGHANIHDAIHRASGVFRQRCTLKSSHNWWL